MMKNSEHIIPVREVKGTSGRLILIEEESDRVALDRFNKEVMSARRGLILSTTHPSKLQNRIEAGQVRWLSKSLGGLNPSKLDYDIYQEVVKFYKDEGGVVLFLGFEYLSFLNGFKIVARSLKKLGDRATVTGGALIVSVNPAAFDEKEVAVLEKTFDYVERSGVGARVIERLSSGQERPGWSYLVLEMKDYKNLRRLREDALCVSTVQPEKLRRWEDFRGKVLWLSETEEEGAVHPSKLRYELLQGITKALEGGCKAVFVDGLEHLIVYTDFPEVVHFLKSISDACAQSGSCLFVSLDVRAVNKQQRALLGKLFDRIVG
jgi:hypothetical protein